MSTRNKHDDIIMSHLFAMATKSFGIEPSLFNKSKLIMHHTRTGKRAETLTEISKRIKAGTIFIDPIKELDFRDSDNIRYKMKEEFEYKLQLSYSNQKNRASTSGCSIETIREDALNFYNKKCCVTGRIVASHHRVHIYDWNALANSSLVEDYAIIMCDAAALLQNAYTLRTSTSQDWVYEVTDLYYCPDYDLKFLLLAGLNGHMEKDFIQDKLFSLWVTDTDNEIELLRGLYGKNLTGDANCTDLKNFDWDEFIQAEFETLKKDTEFGNVRSLNTDGTHKEEVYWIGNYKTNEMYRIGEGEIFKGLRSVLTSKYNINKNKQLASAKYLNRKKS